MSVYVSCAKIQKAKQKKRYQPFKKKKKKRRETRSKGKLGVTRQTLDGLIPEVQGQRNSSNSRIINFFKKIFSVLKKVPACARELKVYFIWDLVKVSAVILKFVEVHMWEHQLWMLTWMGGVWGQGRGLSWGRWGWQTGWVACRLGTVCSSSSASWRRRSRT